MRNPASPLGMKFHHITARVSDIQRAIGWYQEVLGFEVRATGTALNGAMQFAHLHLPGFDLVSCSWRTQRWRSVPVSRCCPGCMWCFRSPILTVSAPLEAGTSVNVRGIDAGHVDTFLLFDSEAMNWRWLLEP